MPGILHTRLTTAGNIYEGSGKLHWLIVSSSEATAGKYCILNDAISGTGGEVAKFYIAALTTKVFLFSPPISLTTGIRIGTFEATTVYATGGYNPY